MIYWKAKTLLEQGKVRLVTVSRNFLYFEVKDYEITIGKKEEYYNCTCFHSQFGIPQKKICSHIRACIMYMEVRNYDLKRNFQRQQDKNQQKE